MQLKRIVAKQYDSNGRLDGSETYSRANEESKTEFVWRVSNTLEAIGQIVVRTWKNPLQHEEVWKTRPVESHDLPDEPIADSIEAIYLNYINGVDLPAPLKVENLCPSDLEEEDFVADLYLQVRAVGMVIEREVDGDSPHALMWILGWPPTGEEMT